MRDLIEAVLTTLTWGFEALIPLGHPGWAMIAVRESTDFSDLGTEANPIVIEDDPGPLGSEFNPVAIHVEEDHSYSETEQLSYDGDTGIIAESWWDQFIGIAGRSTPIPVPTQLTACKDPEEPHSSGQSSANHSTWTAKPWKQPGAIPMSSITLVTRVERAKMVRLQPRLGVVRPLQLLISNN